jgi:hypothetical protein
MEVNMNGHELVVTCADSIKISTVWRDGAERWSVKFLSISQNGVRKWRKCASSFSSHSATAWTEACLAGYRAYRKLPSYDVEATKSLLSWFARNRISISD